LEEPPPHVKFLLATTDPQKLPVTVLSRCLQFNLTRLTPRLIRDRLDFICKEESVSAEASAVGQLARAADGSLRDALSLLDQAIAYCGGEVSESATAEMLGTIDRQYVLQLLRCLAAGDAAGLLAALADIDQQFPDYGQLLDDLARALQRIAVFQVVGQENDDEELAGEVLNEFADSIPAADLQLFYQTAITGRRDLRLAPDPRSGAEMTLLRMLAFRPAGDLGEPVTVKKTAARPPAPPTPGTSAPTKAAAPSSSAQPETQKRRWNDPDWSALVGELELQSANRLLASNCALLGRDGLDVCLQLDPSAEAYLTRTRQEALQSALASYFDEPLKLTITVGDAAAETPVQQKARKDDEALQAATDNLRSDPNVQNLIETFGAEMNSESVRLVDKQ
ncbi:MAG: DNA polymerase III subunit gamma/tau C-terminal domain-containing protein, partial [Pseudomonadota bacterium]